MKILIVGGGLQGLSCGESLYEHHEVSIVAKDLMCRKSKFFHKVYADVEMNESLLSFLEREHFDVLIPVSDMTVPYVSKNKAMIEEKYGIKCACPTEDLLATVGDKHTFMAFCAENDIPHPKTSTLSEKTMEKAAMSVGFPSLIKPDFSVGARGITRVDSLEELRKRFLAVSGRFGTCTLQELVENEEYYYNVMLYRTKDGRFLGCAISKIVRMYPVHAGSSSCLVTVENDEILRICKDCLDKLNWVGMADFDVLQRLDNGEYKIIEIKTRVPASLRAAYISGINFPEIIVRNAMKEEVPRDDYQPGKTLRYLGIDIMWLLKSPKRFIAKPSWLQFIGKDIYYQDIFRQDPSTWWTWLAEGIGKITQRNKKLR